MFDINGFRNVGLPQGGARPSNFEVFFPQLPAVPGNVAVNQTTFRAQAATLPEFRASTIDVFYQGRAIKVAGERTFVPWTVRFYNEIDFQLRNFFEGWSNMMNTLIGNQVYNTDNIMAVQGGYKVDQVRVTQFSKQLSPLRAYDFYGMYPEIVSAIELNWEAANRIETFDVQFAYDYFIPNPDIGVAPGTYDVEGVGAQTIASGATVAPVSELGAATVLQVSG